VRKFVLAAALLGALTTAGQAAAANYKVFLGEQARPPAGTPKGATLDVFLPGKVTVKTGDSITFSSATFHTVAIGGKEPSIIVPDPEHGKYSGIDDAAGKPFYFNGLGKLVYNGLALAPYGPHAVTPGAKANSGVLSPNGPKAAPATFTFSFPKAGTYHFYCGVHPGMKATVTVTSGAAPKSPAQVTAQALQETAAAWTKTKQEAAAAKPPAKTVYMGVGNGPNILGYYPSTLKVPVGTTVNFVNKSPMEPHSATFGPKKWIQQFSQKTDIFPTGPGKPNQAAPVIPYGSEPKGSYSYDGKTHGNGFFSTPVTSDTKSIPLPQSWKVTFTKPGTFKYICWIHGPDMSGTIVVTP
jgi:plastocyanin